MNTLIIDNQYFGNIIYYSILFNNKHVKLESCESFQKMSFRNRCNIAGSNGIIDFSIPVEGGRNNRALVKDIKINYTEPWQKRYWKTLRSNYSKSAFWEYYVDDLNFLFEKKSIFLWDMNIEILKWTLKKLMLSIELSETDSYEETYNEDIKDYRNLIKPSTLHQFQCQPYIQVFASKTGFIPNLSVLDLLMCEGPNAINIIRQTAELNREIWDRIQK